MREEAHTEEEVPAAVEAFVKQLLVAHKAARLYPPASDIPRESAADLLTMLHELLREQPELRFHVTRDALLYDGVPVLPGARPFESFARELYQRNLVELRFHAGVTPKEAVDFLRVLQESPDAITAAGGIEQRLWDQQVDGITVRSASTKIVDTGLTEEPGAQDSDEKWPPSRQRIDELIDSAYDARPRDHRTLVRFAQDPNLLSRYLNEFVSEGRAGRPLTNLIAGKIVSLAHAAMTELDEDQPAILRSISESLLDLDPQVRRDVLVDRLLPESRLDESVAAVIHQFDTGELCRALVEGMEPDPVCRDGLCRAIRNLAMISLHPREEVLEAASKAMREAGMDAGSIAAVVSAAVPDRLSVAQVREASTGSLEEMLGVVDLAPVAQDAVDEGVTELRREVAEGISNGDILVAVVTLVSSERRPEMFASLMSIIEDSIGLLLDIGEYDDASAVAGALKVLEDDKFLVVAQRERVRLALVEMASPRHMREVVGAIRIHARGTAEHESCRRLITTLGGLAIPPLLEVLANEPDMAARKLLVDVVSSMAPQHIAKLGERTSDPRWFFVRNVIAILGSTRSVDALSHLNRTLRHGDARVRRETIRAVASIRDRLSEEMLCAALSDEDGQNVALAARYLGNLGASNAVSALALVARGEGRGDRESASRIEAIEALGRIGTPAAKTAIQDVARQRGILRTGRSREVQAAAEAALASIAEAERRGGK
ncbi:MAG: HEAT repeat domain-containing protein [Coriobacteriia bacterium]|nr:HEAT repeat domain-containing protein [Coriobacteriia bacterium]